MKIILTTGAVDLPAAIFIYKADGSTNDAWQQVEDIARREGALRGELHASKASFLGALRAWNESVDPVEAFLCIYSHAEEVGIAPVSDPDDSEIIKWDELADSLPHGVRYLWLLGCKTAHADLAWARKIIPVAHHILFTLASAYWQPFMQFFAREISVKEILPPDELVSRLRADAPISAKYTIYQTNRDWRPR